MNNQKMKRKKERQKELAKLLSEMGMDQDLIASLSGVTAEEMKEANSVDKVAQPTYNKARTKNNSYSEPRD